MADEFARDAGDDPSWFWGPGADDEAAVQATSKAAPPDAATYAGPATEAAALDEATVEPVAPRPSADAAPVTATVGADEPGSAPAADAVEDGPLNGSAAAAPTSDAGPDDSIWG